MESRKGGDMMNLAKAIELLKIYLRHPLCNMTQDEKDATQKAIDAMTFIQLCLQHDWDVIVEVRHGETLPSDSP